MDTKKIIKQIEYLEDLLLEDAEGYKEEIRKGLKDLCSLIEPPPPPQAVEKMKLNDKESEILNFLKKCLLESEAAIYWEHSEISGYLDLRLAETIMGETYLKHFPNKAFKLIDRAIEEVIPDKQKQKQKLF